MVPRRILNNSFAMWLSKEMAAARCSTIELSRKTGINVKTLYSYLNCTSTPHLQYLSQIARALPNADMDELLRGVLRL